MVLAVFLGKLDVIFSKNKQGGLEHVKGLLQLHGDRRMLLLIPMIIYLGMEEGFVYGEMAHVSGKVHRSKLFQKPFNYPRIELSYY